MIAWKELKKFGQFLRDKFSDQLTEHTGDIHDYLGIDLDYSKSGRLGVSMIKYLHKLLTGFSGYDNLRGDVKNPAHGKLFEVRDEKDADYLSEEQATEFHHVTAQLLFLCNRARCDIQNVVAFLTTRVKKPDIDDWGKLKRVLAYLKNTKYMKLTITVDDMSIIRWWVDASDRTHHDCRGHSGIMMTLGGGAPVSKSTKQRINTKSSTESELVSLDDALPLILWCLYFIEAQGYLVDKNIVYQDNMSTIRLAVNGSLSSSSLTKHIKARYYFIKYKVDKGKVTIEHCPTGQMWNDVLNKPKQNLSFRKDRSKLMNVPVEYDNDKEFLDTHPDLLPEEDRLILEKMKIFGSKFPSRSVLGDLDNRKPSGILRNNENPGNIKNNVTWAKVAG